MSYHFVLNRNAGHVDVEQVIAAIRRHFDADSVQVHFDVPSLTQIEPSDVVVAVGGDGTVNRVINGVSSTSCTLGIIPRGTSNDLARAMEIPFNLDAACLLLRLQHRVRIDLIAVNSILFATVGGIGLPSAIADRANRWKSARRWKGGLARLLGRGVYVAAALRELLWRWRPVTVSVGRQNRIRPKSMAALIVSNQPRLGPFCASPQAVNDDGELDVCFVRTPRPRIGMLWIALRMLAGKGNRCASVEDERVRELEIRTSEPVSFLGDGEILAWDRSFVVRTLPRALSVIAAVPGLQRCSRLDDRRSVERQRAASAA